MYNHLIPVHNDFFPDFFEDAFDGFLPVEHRGPKPHAPRMRTDIREVEGGYELDIEMPGVAKDAVSIKLSDDMLTVAADLNTELKDDKHGFVRRERLSGHMERTFNVEGIDHEAIAAAYKDGVLTLKLPKLAEKPKVEKTIAIEEAK